MVTKMRNVAAEYYYVSYQGYYYSVDSLCCHES